MFISKEDAIQKNRMAMRLERGEGMPMDQERARQLFRDAAEAGLDAAQNNLGYRLYFAQCGFECNVNEAIEWYEKAAKQDYVSAVMNLFKHYRNRDLDKATQYAEQANELPLKAQEKELLEGSRWIQRETKDSRDAEPIEIPFSHESYSVDNLFREGQMYMHGQSGHEKNPNKAAKIFKKTADEGHSGAAFELGQCYRFGRGVVKDLDEAEKYLEAATQQNVLYAKESLEKVQREKLQLGDRGIEDYISLPKQDDIAEKVKTILNESTTEERCSKWAEFASFFSTENITAIDGQRAFHIGALALAGCSKPDGRKDLFNALYWFQKSNKLKYIWGALGLALIDQTVDKREVAKTLLYELDRPFNLDDLLLHRDAFVEHIEEYCSEMMFISSLRIILDKEVDEPTLDRFESNWFNFLNETEKNAPQENLSESDGNQLFSGVLFCRIKIPLSRDAYDLERLGHGLNDMCRYINSLKQPDTFSIGVLSAANVSLAEIGRLSQETVKRKTEERVIALQSHTLKGPLGNAVGLLEDIRRWHNQKKDERIPIGLAALQSNIGILRNMIDANNLILFSKTQFELAWQQDNQNETSLTQVILEAAQQAVLRLTAKEFRLNQLMRQLSRVDVDRTAADIALIDFSVPTQRNFVRSGFPAPFNYIKVCADDNLSLFVGADGIRRQFFFTLAHELIFNAIKYENSESDIEIAIYFKNNNLVFSCRNGYREGTNTSFRATSRGHDFMRQIVAKLDGAILEMRPENSFFIAKLSINIGQKGEQK